MKKAFFVLLAVLFCLTGCEQKLYSLPWDGFCYRIESHEEVSLAPEDKNFIIELFNSGDWEEGLCDCDCDFIFYTEKQEVRYHSSCGTFNDYTNLKSLRTTEADREKINRMLPEPDVRDEVITDEEVRKLREKCPEYFGLYACAGLDVVVWQMAPNHYSFGLLEHSEDPFDGYSGKMMNFRGVSAQQMRAILSTYTIDEENISILPWQNPVSSYIGELWIVREGESREQKEEAYIKRIRTMLFDGEIICQGITQ